MDLFSMQKYKVNTAHPAQPLWKDGRCAVPSLFNIEKKIYKPDAFSGLYLFLQLPAKQSL